MSQFADARGHAQGDSANALPRYTVRTFRVPAKVFHWVSAGFVFFMVATGVTMKQLGSGPTADLLFTIHKTTGILTLVIVLLRIVYRFAMPDTGTHREGYRSPFLHLVLYAALISMPLLGWAGVSAFGSRGILSGIELPSIWPEGSPYGDFLLETHAYLAFGMLALVALHIGIAMQDHLMRARDARQAGH